MRKAFLLLPCFIALATVLGATTPTSLRISDLEQPVEILKDRWGVSHIYAKTEHDLFFAQGWSAAKDRLFQFELWRRRATGTVAEILGRRELERDIGARLFRFRGDLDQELRHYHPRGKEIVGAFVEGINAYIASTEKDPDLLPIEFQMLGIKPGKWTAADVISRHQGLLSNLTTEMRLSQAVAAIGAEAVRELDWFRPGQPVLALDPAIKGELLSEEIIHLYRAFRRPLRFEAGDIVETSRGTTLDQQAMLEAQLPTGDGSDQIGSNNWVVSGRFTQTGFPYLANDPHRTVALPSLRYFVHLVGPGWDVIGGGEPVLPGISIGHNQHGAWGLTVFGQDNEDLYVYETNPQNPTQYRYRDAWEDMTTIQESIPVKGGRAEVVELKYTRHGPVLFEDPKHNVAYALRAAWLEVGNAPYLASLRMNQATTWEEFVEACSYSRLPAENMIWGDRDKQIGYQAVGISPIRPNWSGLVPVPGDGRYEWEGFLPITALPRIKNPDKGYFASANNYMVPDGYPHQGALHYTWGDEMRGLRVDELMSSGKRFTMVDMMEFQHDELSIPARNIVPLLKPLEFTAPNIARAATQLLDWDFVLEKTSSTAAIYVSFERRLLRNLRQRIVPKAANRFFDRLNKKRVIDWLTAPDGRFGDSPIAGRDALLKQSLTEAIADLEQQLGTDPEAWAYGSPAFKHVEIRHPLSRAVNSDTQATLDVGPLPRGGDSSTLNNTGNADNQRAGATFRVIMDTANWDNSIATSAPGQSGDPSDPHYRDLFELWARNQYFPLFYSRQKIESVTESKLTLSP